MDGLRVLIGQHQMAIVAYAHADPERDDGSNHRSTSIREYVYEALKHRAHYIFGNSFPQDLEEVAIVIRPERDGRLWWPTGRAFSRRQQ